MTTQSMSDQQRAEASAQAMWNEDRASQWLGMKIDSVGPGHATLSMAVARQMTNGHDSCHGGFIFALADSAFAFACNSHNQRAVAQMVQITYIAPAHHGDILTAQAREVSRRGRSGIYDIRVTNQHGDHIAEFRGHSRTVKGTLVPEPTE